MPFLRHLRLVIVAAAAGLASPVLAAPADATNATAAELQALFQRQKSRGLKLAPGTGLAAAPTGVAVATGATAVAAAPATAAPGTTVAPAADAPVLVPVAYAELDEADQVNIRIAFDFDSAVLRESEKGKLAQLCLAIQAVDIPVFRIVGHTDAAGTDDYNDRLSLLRAEEVKRHLVTDCGIAPERLEAVGVGKRYLSDPDDPRGEVNRRVEFQALS
jgi:outer membrane protein OmpA-like peptidoglycan-associated protein